VLTSPTYPASINRATAKMRPATFAAFPLLLAMAI
jgi:hypothetical protein